MQIQCHIVLYLPDYHVNTHRVCSTVRVFAMARHLKTVSRKYAQKLIVVQMFNYFRQPCYCKYHVQAEVIVFQNYHEYFSINLKLLYLSNHPSC
jgi:hypothetical protein